MSKFTSIRDIVETAGSLAGNYALPGSSLVTDKLVSKGAQNNLNSPLGQIANFATGLTGSGIGSSFTGIPSAADEGLGWTNALNGAGSLVGSPTAGTDLSNFAFNNTGGLVGSSSTPSGGGLGSSLTSSGAGSPVGFTPSASGSGLTGGGLNSGVGGGSSAYAGAGGDWAIPGGSAQLDLASADPSLVKLQNAPGFSGATSTAANAATSGGSSMLGGNSQLLGSLLGGATSLYSNNQAQGALLDANKKAQAQLAPYLASGAGANNQLSTLLGTNGNTGAAGYGTLGQPFTPADLTQTPGYQFQLQQGQQALNRQNAATGNTNSGGALKEAEQFGTGLANTTYNQQLQNYLAQQQQQYGMLAGQSGAGLNAAGLSGNLGTSIGTAQGASDIATGNTINSTLASLLTGSGAYGQPKYNALGQRIA